jgi:hypothetical protein
MVYKVQTLHLAWLQLLLLVVVMVLDMVQAA